MSPHTKLEAEFVEITGKENTGKYSQDGIVKTENVKSCDKVENCC